jgi:hypothetical protein
MQADQHLHQKYYLKLCSDELKKFIDGSSDNFPISTTKGVYLFDENTDISVSYGKSDTFFIVQYQDPNKNKFCGICSQCIYGFYDRCLFHKNEPQRSYTVFIDPWILIKIIGDNYSQGNTYLELIRGWLRQKLRFDIDILNKHFEYCEKVKDTLITTLCEVFRHEFNIDLSKDIVVTCSSGMTDKGFKYSLHIILDNYCCVDGDHTKAIFEEVYKRLPEEYKENNYVDKQIYSTKYKTSSLRMLKCVKAHSLTEWNYNGQKIKYDEKEAKEKHLERWEFYISLITFTNHCKLIQSYKPINVEKKISRSKLTTKENNIDVESVLDLCNQSDYIRNNFEFVAVEKEKFYVFRRTSEALCLICNRSHESCGLFVELFKNQIRYACYRDFRKPRQYITIGSINVNKKIEKKIPIVIDDVPKSEWDLTYNSPYVRPINLDDCETLLVRAPMGSGKSHGTKKFISDNPSIKRILMPTPRTTHATNSTSEYGMGFQHYQECNADKIDYRTIPRLVVQIESLMKLKSGFKPYDLLILDEIESLFRQLASNKTMSKKLHAIICILKDLIKNAKYVICTDAFLSARTIEIIKELRSHTKIRCEWNTHIKVKRQAIKYDSFSHLNAKALELLKNGKKIYYVLSSKKKADELKKTLETHLLGIKILIYTKTDGDRSTLNNIRNIWNQYDILITTSTITVGVNFDIPYFDHVFIYCSSFGPPVRDIFQSHMRVRELKENQMHYCIYSRPNCIQGAFIKSIEDMKINLDEHRRKITEFTEKIAETYPIYTFFLEPEPWVDNNLVHCMFEANLTRHCVEEVFDGYLEICGYTKIKVSNKNILKSEKVEDKKFEDILNISYSEYKQIDENIKMCIVPQEDYEKHEKYKFVNQIIKKNIDENIQSIIYNHTRPNKTHLEHLRLEKNKTIGEVHNNEIYNSQYKSMCSFKGPKLSIIHWLNSKLGISHSTEIKVIDSKHIEGLYSEIMRAKQEIYYYFNFTDNSKGKETELNQTVDVINRIYKHWSGSELKRRPKQRKTIKGKVDNIAPYDFGVLTCSGYLDIYKYIRKIKKANIVIENSEEMSTFLNINSSNNIIFPEQGISSPITPILNIVSPITPVLNIISPISPLEGQVTPCLNIISSLKDDIKKYTVQQLNSSIMPVFNIFL